MAKPRSGTASTANGTAGVSKKPMFTRNPANLSSAHLRAGTSVPKSGLASTAVIFYHTWYLGTVRCILDRYSCVYTWPVL